MTNTTITYASHLRLGNEQEEAAVPLRNYCFKIKKAVVVLKDQSSYCFKIEVQSVVLKLKCTHHLKSKVQLLATPSTFVLQIEHCC
jgi:hypothetical protein